MAGIIRREFFQRNAILADPLRWHYLSWPKLIFCFASFEYIRFSIAHSGYQHCSIILVIGGALPQGQAVWKLMFCVSACVYRTFLIVEFDLGDQFRTLFSTDSNCFPRHIETSVTLIGLLLALGRACLYRFTLITKKVQANTSTFCGPLIAGHCEVIFMLATFDRLLPSFYRRKTKING